MIIKRGALSNSLRMDESTNFAATPSKQAEGSKGNQDRAPVSSRADHQTRERYREGRRALRGVQAVHCSAAAFSTPNVSPQMAGKMENTSPQNRKIMAAKTTNATG